MFFFAYFLCAVFVSLFCSWWLLWCFLTPRLNESQCVRLLVYCLCFGAKCSRTHIITRCQCPVECRWINLFVCSGQFKRAACVPWLYALVTFRLRYDVRARENEMVKGENIAETLLAFAYLPSVCATTAHTHNESLHWPLFSLTILPPAPPTFFFFRPLCFISSLCFHTLPYCRPNKFIVHSLDFLFRRSDCVVVVVSLLLFGTFTLTPSLPTSFFAAHT